MTRKHTPITSEAQRGLFGAELARKRAGKATKTGISEEDLVGHLHESKGKNLPAHKMEKEKSPYSSGVKNVAGQRWLNEMKKPKEHLSNEELYNKLKSKNTPIATDSPYHESTIPKYPRGKGEYGDIYGKSLIKSIDNFISKVMPKHIPFIAATRQAKQMGYRDFSFGSEGRAIRDKIAQEIGRKHGIKVKTTWKMEKELPNIADDVGSLTNVKMVKSKTKKRCPNCGSKYKPSNMSCPYCNSPKTEKQNTDLPQNQGVFKGEKGKAIGSAIGSKLGDIAEEALKAKFGRKVKKCSDGKMIKQKIDHLCKSIEDMISKDKPKLGTGKRFEQLKGKLEGKKGVYDPAGLAAAIGRKKYGKKKFQSLAAKG